MKIHLKYFIRAGWNLVPSIFQYIFKTKYDYIWTNRPTQLKPVAYQKTSNPKEKNKILKFALVILLVSFTSVLGQNIRQADYYVDGINGNDSNNGTSPATAKKSIGGIIALGSNIAGKTIALRDSIIYRNSSTTETWRITASNVTITNWWENVSTRFWGGADILPRITGGQQITNWSNYSGNIWSSTTNVSSASAVWLTFPGDSCVWGEQMSGVGSLVREGQYYISGGTMYINAPSDPDSYYESVDRDDRSSIIYVNSGTNVTINNIEVYGSTNFNIFFNEGTEGGVVDNCISHHAGTYSNLLVGGGSHCIQTRSGITIKNSVFYEGTNHGIHLYPMNSNLSGVIIEHNIVFNCHHTGIDQNSSGPTISGMIIRYNKVYETTWARERQFANFANSSHQIGIWEQGSMVQNAEVAYNLVYNSYRGNIALNGSNNSVYNNTVVHTVAPLSSYSGSDMSGNGVARNNIVYEMSGIDCISGFTTSNNVTYNTGNGGTSGGTNANPQFQNYTGLNFHLQSGSPAIDYGTNLGYTYDLDGNTIVGNPDAGAYEYNGGGGGGNTPPNSPTNPSPGDGALNQPVNTTVSWNCSDPNGDPLTYDVYFGTSNNPPLVSGNQTAASYNPGGLNNSTVYYWKITAKDNQGGVTAGPVWSFTTVSASGNNPPNSPTNPSPGNGALNQPVNTTVSWSCTDPEGDPLTYDVYFGTTNNPPLVSGNQTAASYNPGGLNNSTVYYWKITAKDNQGGVTTGPVWNFTTVDNGTVGDNIPPELMGVQCMEADQVVLDFSEPLSEGPVSNLGNYLISDQIQVLSAQLSMANQRVTLTTSPQIMNHIYTVAVSNLTDTAGNVISSQASSLFYKYLEIGSTEYVEHLINSVSASATTDTNTSPIKTLDGLVNGDPDPNSRWAAEVMPQWIQYDLGAIESIGLIAVSFYQWNTGRIYQYSIQASNDMIQWNDLVTNVSSGSQEWAFNEFADLSAQYVRIICLSNNQGDWAGVWEARVFEPSGPTSVEYTLFTATVNDNNKVELNWTTATEQNCKQFNITRKDGNNDFKIIGTVPGHGSVSVPQSYTFTDNSVRGGHYSYRLEEEDFSGHVQYSSIVEVEVNMPQIYSLEQNYPNPFNPSTHIDFSVPEESQIILKIYDILGNEIKTLVNEMKGQGYYEVEFNAADLPSGIYLSRIQAVPVKGHGSDFVSVKKMILLK